MDRVKFAIIGVGGFGRKRIEAIMRSDIAELRYVVDHNTSAAEVISKNTGAEVVTSNELFTKSDYDVADVAVPNKWHRELVIRLLDAGKDVLCEKPMTTTTKSSREMLSKSIETTRILKVGSNVRYFPNVARASELIAEGFLGKILFFRGWIGNEGLHLQSEDWYSKKTDIGGGTLLDNGIHLIDLIRYLVDEIAKCNACECSNLQWSLKGLEDNAMCVYSLLKRGIGVIHSSWTEKSGYMYLEIHGDQGFVCIDSRWSKAVLTYGKTAHEPTIEDYTNVPKLSYDLELEDFVKCYRRGAHARPTSYDGFRAVKTIMKSYQAYSLGRPTATIDKSDMKLRDQFTKAFGIG